MLVMQLDKNREEEMSDLDQIKALDSGVADGVNAGDATAVASYYAEDAAILPPGAARMDGREAIQGYWQAGIDGGLSDVSIIGETVEITGDTSITVGNLSGKMGDANLAGKYIVIAKKTNGGWKIHRDIWNFDA
jgi:uncharacterized protein (TIGR02246 family)